MASKKHSVEVVIGATDNASKEIDKVGGALKVVAGAAVLGGVIVAAKAAGAAMRGLVGFMVESARAAEVQARAERDLRVALDLSGKATDGAAGRIIAYAGELQRVSTAGDEVSIRLATMAVNMGATEDQAKLATRAAIDLASATGKNANEAMAQLTKTLGGYAGELGEVFPALRALTKEQLQNGDGIRLLANRYRGAATANLTLGQRTIQATNSFNDFREEVGKSITESTAFNGVIDSMTGFFETLKDTVSELDLGQALAEAAASAVALAGGLSEVMAALGSDRAERLAAAFADLQYQLDQNAGRAGENAKQRALLNAEINTQTGNIRRLAGELDTLSEKERALGQIDTSGMSNAELSLAVDTLQTVTARRKEIERQIVAAQAAIDEMEKKAAATNEKVATSSGGGRSRRTGPATGPKEATKEAARSAIEYAKSVIALEGRIRSARLEGVALIQSEAETQLDLLSATYSAGLISYREFELERQAIAAESEAKITDEIASAAKKASKSAANEVKTDPSAQGDWLGVGLSIGGMLAQGIAAAMNGEKGAGKSILKGLLGMLPGILAMIPGVGTAAAGAIGIGSTLLGGLINHTGSPGYIQTAHGGVMAGDETLIRAQSREAILSRQAVDRMGGPGAVAALNGGLGGGGGSIVVNLSALDTQSLDDAIRRGGLGDRLAMAIRRGRGPLAGAI